MRAIRNLSIIIIGLALYFSAGPLAANVIAAGSVAG